MPSTKHQDQGRRMNDWVRATTNSLTPEEAIALMRGHLEASLPASPLQRRYITDLHDGLLAKIELGFGVGGELTLRLERTGPPISGFGSAHADAVAIPYGVTIGLSWSGTTRTLAEAVSSVDLYEHLIALAADVEAHFARQRITRIEAPPPGALV